MRNGSFMGADLVRNLIERVIRILVPEFAVIFGTNTRAVKVVDVTFDKAVDDELDRFSIAGNLG